jgi:REP-associated tyrosine transposase
MARPLRIQRTGLTYHVMSRGNAKMAIYKDDQDRQTFLSILQIAVTIHAVRLCTYCEMTTHYHLVCQTTQPNLSCAIRDLNGGYAQYFNRRYERVGHLFQARFTAQVVEEGEYLRELYRYVALNPVRGGVVARAELWPWSAHRALAGLDPEPPFLTTDVLAAHFGNSDLDTARRHYVEFLAAPRGYDEWAQSSPFRRSTPIVGSADFVARFNETLITAPREVPRRERLLARPTLPRLLSGVPSRRELNDRILSAHDQYGYTLEEIAALIGLPRASVFRRLEDARKSFPTTREIAGLHRDARARDGVSAPADDARSTDA